MRFIYEVECVERTRTKVTLGVTEQEMDTLTHSELEQRAIKVVRDGVSDPFISSIRDYRAELIERVR